jgi:hypothetical protein
MALSRQQPPETARCTALTIVDVHAIAEQHGLGLSKIKSMGKKAKGQPKLAL